MLYLKTKNSAGFCVHGCLEGDVVAIYIKLV